MNLRVSRSAIGPRELLVRQFRRIAGHLSTTGGSHRYPVVSAV
ncbi:hypothetical protein [Nocardia rhamnosiphila]|nr:hypothetical protein [Nocardia rhamnosiphila]